MDSRYHNDRSQHTGADDLLERVQSVSQDAVHIGTFLQMQLYPESGFILDEAAKARLSAMSMSLSQQAMVLMTRGLDGARDKAKPFSGEYICAPTLLRYLFARITEWNYCRTQPGTELSPYLQRRIESKDAAVSERAMADLVAQSRNNFAIENYRYPITELPAELVYELVWDAARYLKKTKVAKKSELKEIVKSVLSGFDESETRLSRLLQHSVGVSGDFALSQEGLISDIGVSQFFALLAIDSSIGLNQLYILSAMPDRAAFAVVMRAAGCSGTRIVHILEKVKLPYHTGNDFGADTLDALATDKAKVMVTRWHGGEAE